ncbi:hypothetical protein VP01_4012g1 [Puccinia sorghi]|uniref:Uncharacterized protein n=1 Tax=Puccinia sorghi TaxID=27349 RepID=A0A0L6URU7_9BASI|nr:hypothetical protein VP01_4012g1 [Puccinia sorghi]
MATRQNYSPQHNSISSEYDQVQRKHLHELDPQPPLACCKLLGAQESESSLEQRKSLSSTPENKSMLPEEFEGDDSDLYVLDDFPGNYAHLSEQAKNTLNNTNHHSQSFYSKSNPFLITLSNRIKSTSFSIDIHTFSCSNDLIVTKDGSGKTVLFLVSFHPLSQNVSTFNCLAETKTRYLEECPELDFEVDMKREKQLVRDFLEHMPSKKTSNLASLHWKMLSRRSFLSTTNSYLIVFGTSLMMHMRRTENLLRNLVSPVGLMNNGKASRTIPTQSAQMSLSPLMTSPIALTLTKTRTCSLMVSSVTSINLAVHLFHQLLTPLGMPSGSLNTTATKKLDYMVSLSKSPSSKLVIWKSNKLTHHTIGPPNELKTTKSRTNFGSFFQIGHTLVARALKLRNLLSF